MKPFRFTVVAVAIALVLNGCGGGSEYDGPPPSGEGAYLQVPFIAQQTQVWCWASTIEMVSAYYDRRVAQCFTLSAYLGGDCCNFPQFCLVAAPNLQTIQNGLFQLSGIRSQFVNGPLSFETIRREIDAGRPIIIAYTGSFSGHVVVIFGYDDAGLLAIHDPFYGTFSQIPYASSFSYGGGLIWAASIIGISP